MVFKQITINILFKSLKLCCIIYLVYVFILIAWINFYLINETDELEGSETTSTGNRHSFPKSQVHLIKPKKFYNKYNMSTDLENRCTLYNDLCFDLFQCVDREHLKVYVYTDFSYGGYTKQFQEYIRTIVESEYYEPDPTLACIFIPAIDLLNEDNIDHLAAESHLHNLE